jgi:hypothetical protein
MSAPRPQASSTAPSSLAAAQRSGDLVGFGAAQLVVDDHVPGDLERCQVRRDERAP